MKRTAQFAFLALAGLTFTAAEARAEPARRVYVGAYLHDVTTFDQHNGVFDVDVDVWVKWRGDFDPSHVRLQNEDGNIDRVDLGSASDGDWHSQRWRIRGTLRGEFPLHRFPFDTQALPIVFELPESEAELAPDLAGSGMAEHFSVTGWTYERRFQPRVERHWYASDLGTIEHEGHATWVRRVRYEVTLHRPPVPIAVKLFLPLLLNLLIAVLALFLAPELVDTRTGIGVTVLLACFAFQYTIAGTIPDVAYLTIVDALFILAYGVTAFALLVTVLSYWLHRNDRHAQALRVDKVARIALPVLVFGTTGFLVRPVPEPPPHHVTPFRLERQTSARDVVRIGVLDLDNPRVFGLGSRQAWGLTRLTARGRTAFLAEEAPSVSNDMMQFRADGKFEIRWHLREGLKWSDGSPLTSDDFRFSHEVSPDPHIVELATPDPRTLVLVYDDVRASALDGIPAMPRHVLGATFRSGGYDAVTAAQRTSAPMATGPYRVTSFTPEQSLVAEANPFFAGPPPSIRRVEIKRFASDVDAVRAFEAGELDVLGPEELSDELSDALEARAPGTVVEHESADLVALHPDLAVPWLADRRVRRAILLAIDRPAFVRDVFGHGGRVALTPSPRRAPAGADPARGDRDRARALLAEAGAVGKTIPLFFEDDLWSREAAAILGASLTSIGLVVEPHEMENTARAYMIGGHGGLLLVLLTPVEQEADPRRYFNVPRRSGRFVDSARNDAYDDTIAELVDHASRAIYDERREELIDRVFDSVPERLPILPLAFAPRRFAASPQLRGVDEHGRGRFGAHLDAWYFVDAAAPTRAAPTGRTGHGGP